jgi:L-iditol 2-dehydrogenase
MLAVVKTRPEPGIEIVERPEPAITQDDHVLLEVAACGVCGSDLHFYEWASHMRGEITLPRILGHEVAGTVVEVGRAVTQFKPGDRVVTETWGGCGRCYYCRLGRFNQCMHQTRIGQKAEGGMARYVIVPDISLYHIPPDMPLDEAAVVEPVGVALHGLERVDLKPGDSVAVIGPGPIGILAAMLADRAGAHRVIVLGLAADEARLDMVRRMGYDVVVTDLEDPVEAVRSRTAGRGVELALDVSGGHGTLGLALDLVRNGGQIGIVGMSPEAPFNPSAAAIKEVTIYGSFRRQPSTWYRAIKLVASRKIDVRPLITHRLPVAQAREAFEILLHREGIKAVITPD